MSRPCSGAYGFLWCMFKKIALTLGFTLFLGLLTACGPNAPLRLNDTESSSPAQNTSSTQTNGNDGIGAVVALPPRFENTPDAPGTENPTYMPNGLPALKPMKGINVETLFAQEIRDTDQRFDRVENVVKDMRKDFETYKPAIVRLAAVEEDIQSLIGELEILLQKTPPAPKTKSAKTYDINAPPDAGSPPPTVARAIERDPDPVQEEQEYDPPIALVKADVDNKPPVQAASAASKAKAAAKACEGVCAQNLRIGEHSNKIRMVFDTSEKTPFSVDLDNEERLMIIELPNATWKSAMSKTLSGIPTLGSYTVEPINDGKGTMIILSLTANTAIITESRLVPDKTSPYHRIYIDITK